VPRAAAPARLVLVLGSFALLSGLIHVIAFLATKDRIEHNRASALTAAVLRVLPGAKDQRALVLRGDALQRYDGPPNTVPKEDAVFEAFDASGRRVGFAIPNQAAGFQDTIKLIFGVDLGAKRIVGMEVLESRETPGLGDKILKDAAFLGQWKALAFDPAVEVTKKGKTKPNEIDAIVGATISSKAVARIVNEGNQRWQGPIGAYATGEGQR